MAHLESFRANTVDSRAAYVAISRARSHAALYTDNRANLTEALGFRDGSQGGAIDETMGRDPASLCTPPTRSSGLALGTSRASEGHQLRHL